MACYVFNGNLKFKYFCKQKKTMFIFLIFKFKSLIQALSSKYPSKIESNVPSIFSLVVKQAFPIS